MNPEDLASQSVRLKEEQLRREEEKLREIEIKVQREINEKRQEHSWRHITDLLITSKEEMMFRYALALDFSINGAYLGHP
jgi:hypothetical protein